MKAWHIILDGDGHPLSLCNADTDVRIYCCERKELEARLKKRLELAVRQPDVPLMWSAQRRRCVRFQEILELEPHVCEVHFQEPAY